MTRSTFTRGSTPISAFVNGLAAAFISSAALAVDGMMTGAKAPANAAPARILRRVMWKVSVIIFLLSLLGQSMLRSVTAFVVEVRKYNLRWSKLRVGPPATFWQEVTASCGRVAPPLCLFAKKRDGIASRHMSRPNEEHYNEWQPNRSHPGAQPAKRRHSKGAGTQRPGYLLLRLPAVFSRWRPLGHRGDGVVDSSTFRLH
ncbi:exported protein of unknown function (plasmid) [Agrobacterium pusense]|uniref:Uncharacterized protein n=1 Tax=Agrobacterium pusense TaxID=648995 RepID=U4QIK2_9HYPH|nr:exported protein of unknown function [Agrobacterium pusense]